MKAFFFGGVCAKKETEFILCSSSAVAVCCLCSCFCFVGVVVVVVLFVVLSLFVVCGRSGKT